jgi:hyperosmotically inducible protein
MSSRGCGGRACGRDKENVALSAPIVGRTGETIMNVIRFAKWLVVIGCATLTPTFHAQASNDMPRASSPAAGSGSAAPSDRQLARDVRKALSKAPHFNVSNVFVKARGGVVTLSGSVSDGAQVQQATKIAQGVPRVTSVINHLSMHPKGY